MLSQVTENGDVLCLTGDLCDYGTAEEAHVLAKELTLAVKVPVVAVLGNHDYEGGQADEIKRILDDAGVTIADGSRPARSMASALPALKDFAAASDVAHWRARGEEAIKAFVREAVSEALKLEAALARLRTEQRIALLHYAPIVGTVRGEPTDIYPLWPAQADWKSL